MINTEKATKYCREDLSLIENYKKAKEDNNEMWDCHHRLETDKGISRNELIASSMYYNRPASELIFMRRSDHKRLHKIGKNNPKHWLGKYGVEHNRSKSVIQLTKYGDFVKKWNCARDAERELGILYQSIYKCCRGICNSAGGFHWVYATDYRRTISDIKPLF